MPSGTWYDYLGGAAKATVTTCVLAPGELKVFTGTPVTAPTFTDIQKRETQGIEIVGQPSEMNIQKVLRDGQIYILRCDGTYTLTGARVQ